ncbi:MAG: T9SS type A sorting domain-containing protein [Bacteroidales bacterium]|nr:T9SS type A sorting domain-containing protein [Bacteroidales bacterium]
MCYSTKSVSNSDTQKFSLQITPNPASEKFSVNYFIPEKQYVEIFLTSLTGKIVNKSYRKWESAEKHSLEFNTAKLNSGVYNLKFKSEKFSETSKLVVK